MAARYFAVYTHVQLTPLITNWKFKFSIQQQLSNKLSNNNNTHTKMTEIVPLYPNNCYI